MLFGADGKFIPITKMKHLCFVQGSVNKKVLTPYSVQGCQDGREGKILPLGAGHRSLLRAAAVTAPAGSSCHSSAICR